MSRIIKCENGHFYDADKFASCPHCNVTKQETKKEKNDSKVEDLDTMVTVAKYLFGGSKRFRKTPDVSGSIVKPPKEHLENEITPEMRQVQQMALGRQKKDDDQLTVRFQLPESGLEPVVGWLVCVTGKSRGKRDHPLYRRKSPQCRQLYGGGVCADRYASGTGYPDRALDRNL